MTQMAQDGLEPLQTHRKQVESAGTVTQPCHSPPPVASVRVMASSMGIRAG